MSNEVIPSGPKHHELKRVLRDLLEKGKAEFAMVLPQHMTPERMIRIAITACTMQPKLLMCTKESVALALLTASQAGIEPDGYHGHLVPYGSVCQFIPDYKGLVQLALENGVVIDAEAVYEKDQFSYQRGLVPSLVHVPSEDEDRGPLRCAYAIAHFASGHSKFVVATKHDVLKRMNSSPGSKGSDSPWRKWPESMWMKTAVKMLMKFVPRSPAIKAALVADDLAERGIPQHPNYILQPPLQIESSASEIVDQVLDEEPTQTADATPKESKTEKAAAAMKEKKVAPKKQKELPTAPEPKTEEVQVPPQLVEYWVALQECADEEAIRKTWSEWILDNRSELAPETYSKGCELRDWMVAYMAAKGGTQ